MRSPKSSLLIQTWLYLSRARIPDTRQAALLLHSHFVRIGVPPYSLSPSNNAHEIAEAKRHFLHISRAFTRNSKFLIYANSNRCGNPCARAPKTRNRDYFVVMNINDPEIMRLRESVAAAREEFDLAVIFHEVWKPAAYDEDLHKRMGVSFATNAFHVVRIALRREMWLALTRLWDKNPKAVKMEFIAKTLSKPHIINALASDRATRLPASEIEIKRHLKQTANQAIELIGKYSNVGSTRQKLQTLRNERLAHREIAAVTGSSATDTEVESFYQDMSKLIGLLLSLVMAQHYDPDELAQVYRSHAKLFWTAVRGERTEGHPNFRPTGQQKT
jgi:hypothetical protein